MDIPTMTKLLFLVCLFYFAVAKKSPIEIKIPSDKFQIDLDAEQYIQIDLPLIIMFPIYVFVVMISILAFVIAFIVDMVAMLFFESVYAPFAQIFLFILMLIYFLDLIFSQKID